MIHMEVKIANDEMPAENKSRVISSFYPDVIFQIVQKDSERAFFLLRMVNN